MAWILAPEPEERRLPFPVVEDLLYSEEYVKSKNAERYLREALRMTSTAIRQTAEETTGQRSNATWSIARKLRLTASNFGDILQAIRLNRLMNC